MSAKICQKFLYCDLALVATYFDEMGLHCVFHIFAQVLFWAGNQVNYQNFDPSVIPINLD